MLLANIWLQSLLDLHCIIDRCDLRGLNSFHRSSKCGLARRAISVPAHIDAGIPAYLKIKHFSGIKSSENLKH